MSGDSSKLRELFKGRVSIICHHNADPDAIGAAYALQRLLAWLDPASIVEILYPDTTSQLSERLIRRYNIEVSKTSKISSVETVIVVDVGSMIQVEALRDVIKNATSRVFIDHHGKDAEIERLATLYISDEEAVATCELVIGLLETFGFEPPIEVAEALLTGIMFDSKHLSIGTPRTFRMVAKLLELGVSLNDAKELLRATMDPSEKIARLKSAQRAKVYRAGSWIIATSNLSSFQASAARGMITLGADVAIVAGNEKKVLKGSIRSTDEFNRLTKIHVGDHVSKPIAAIFGGEGGGHSTAAGINGVGDADEFLDRVVVFLSDKIGKSAQVLYMK